MDSNFRMCHGIFRVLTLENNHNVIKCMPDLKTLMPQEKTSSSGDHFYSLNMVKSIYLLAVTWAMATTTMKLFSYSLQLKILSPVVPHLYFQFNFQSICGARHELQNFCLVPAIFSLCVSSLYNLILGTLFYDS